MKNKYFKIKENPKGIEIEDSVLTITEQGAAKMEIPFNKKWLNVFWWIVVFSLIILAGKTVYLNIVKGRHYSEIAQGNSIRHIAIKAPRGKIYDRFGQTLAHNIPGINLIAIPADLPKKTLERKDIAGKLAEILKANGGEIWGTMENLDPYSISPILLKENISQEEALIVLEKEKELRGIKIEKTAIRSYNDGLIFSHILGYEGKIKKEELKKNPDYLLTDRIGKLGVEKSYEKYLRGVPGAFKVEVDSLGNIKKELGIIEPQLGSDLILNIDSGLQKKIFDALSEALKEEEIKKAAAVAIDPRDGGVLALVSLPSFDNNLFAGGISSSDYQKLINDPSQPLFNRAISGEYPPGSTIKPIMAVAALSEKIISESSRIESRGGIRVGNYFFGDWKAHGFTDVRKAIAVSSDVFFYSVGGGYGGIEGLGMNRMKKYDNLFGLGNFSRIDIPGEAKGLIPDEKWKKDVMGEKWYVGDSYHAAIGQGFITATPLQIANYAAAIANGGTLYQPRIVSQIKKSDGESINCDAKIIGGKLASDEIIKIVQEGMRMTITEGTATVLNNLSVAVAGKTGTAQFGTEDKTHGWFVSYAPYETPKIAMVILVEGQMENEYNAAPITKEIYEWYFKDAKN
ncbi:penicillin-binding protein 2 [bacterium]|nr:penicillin-binding protein 2 [bacterium]